MRQTFNLTGDGFESLHFYQNGSVADKVMQGSHKPYECGFDSHLNLQFVGDIMFCANKDCDNKAVKGGKYCSRSCAARVNNKSHPKRRQEGSCHSCGKQTPKSRKYCDECISNGILKQYKNPDEEKKAKSQHVKKSRDKLKRVLVDYKGGCCSICGYNKCIKALEFHHLDPNTKDFTVGQKHFSIEVMKSEVDKCVLLCANCHREVHEGVTML